MVRIKGMIILLYSNITLRQSGQVMGGLGKGQLNVQSLTYEEGVVTCCDCVWRSREAWRVLVCRVWVKPG